MSKYWNADDWHLYLSQLLDARANFPDGLNKVALKIADTMEEVRATQARAASDHPGHWSDGGKVWEGRPGGDYQHGYADGIEWATVHAQPASPLRKALQRAYDFLQDKSFMPDALTHECTKVLEQMEEALAAECPLCPGFSTACGNSNCPQLAQPASPLRGRDATIEECAKVAECWYFGSQAATHIRELSASPPEQPAADNVKTLLETIDAKNARIAELEEALGKAVLAPVEGRESWALLYLHDWDPPKEGQEHKWEPGKNIFPELHGKTFSTLQEADAARRRMSNPDKYWVRRFNSPTAPEPELPKARPMGQS